MAHVLTDEAFALSIRHFRRIGRIDDFGYWIAAIGVTFIPWNLATLAGVLLGDADPRPGAARHRRHLPGRDGGLAVGLITGRRELVAAVVGAAVGVVVVAGGRRPTVGIIAGGVVGPLVGLLVPAATAGETAPLGSEASADRLQRCPGTTLDDEPGATRP